MVADSFKFLLPHLDSMIMDDQRYRQTNDSNEFTANWWQKQNPLDSLNTIKLKELLLKFGWLDIRQVGLRTNGMFYIIQHCRPIEEKEFFMPYLYNAYRMGKLPSIGLFAFIDRYLWDKNEPQLFGTQLVSVGNKVATGLKDIYPIYQPAYINERWKRYSTFTDYNNFVKQSFKTVWDAVAYQQYIPELARLAKVQMEQHLYIDMMLLKLDSCKALMARKS